MPCDKNCNECPIINHPNTRIVRVILDDILWTVDLDAMNEVLRIVNSHCSNLTVCPSCLVDDFCHAEGCEFDGDKSVSGDELE